jgi:dihydrofolate reductase
MSQRRIVTFHRITVDGYFSGPDGNLDFFVPDPDLDRAAAGAIAQGGPDLLLFGRRTYQQFEAFWGHVLDQPSAAAPHGDGPLSAAMRAMAVMLNETPKVVFSRTLKAATWNNSRCLSEIDPGAIEALKREPGRDILLFGSGSILSQLTEHRLVDEYRFVVSPILLGSGRSPIEGVSNLALTLLEAKPTAAGNVELRYAPSA